MVINLGFVAVLLGSAFFGTAGVFVKTLDLPVTVIACFRVLVPAVYFLYTQKEVRNKILSDPNPRLMLASLLTASRIFIWVLAFLFAAMSKAVIILYTWPILLTILSATFLGEEVSSRTKKLLSMAFFGILLIYSGEEFTLSNRDFLGMGLMLLVAILNAMVVVIFKKELKSHSHKEVVLYDNLVGSIIFFPFLLYHFSDLSLVSIVMGITYGFLIGLVGYSLFYYGLSKVKASLASILSYMEVIIAMVLGVTFFGEIVTWQMLLGGGIILISTFFVRNEK